MYSAKLLSLAAVRHLIWEACQLLPYTYQFTRMCCNFQKKQQESDGSGRSASGSYNHLEQLVAGLNLSPNIRTCSLAAPAPSGSWVLPRIRLGWKGWGYARRFKAEIVNYADDFVVLGHAPVAIMRTAVEELVKRLKLTLNAEKTREVRVPEEPLEFHGYRIGLNSRRDTGQTFIGTRPSPASVQCLYRRVSELTERRYGLLEPERVVRRLNRLLNRARKGQSASPGLL